MLTIIILLVVVSAVCFQIQASHDGGLISHHNFNDPNSDASAAREDHVE